MSAFTQLWHRAPLWRMTFVLTIVFLLLCLIFPSRWIEARAPWLNLTTLFSRQPFAAGAPSELGTTTAPTADPSPSSTRFLTPDITTSFIEAIPFGGGQLPLPAGVWHPLIAGQTGPDGSISFTALARTDRGVVTGIVIAETTAQAAVAEAVNSAADRCHDDRNYAVTLTADKPDRLIECAFVTYTLRKPQQSPQLTNLIRFSFNRLEALGFPLPSLFLVAGWMHISAETGADARSFGVTYLIPPVERGSLRLRAPQAFWTKENLAHAPKARAFVARTQKWFRHWVPIVKKSLYTLNGLPPDMHTNLEHDPVAP